MSQAVRVVLRNLLFGVAGEALSGVLNFLTFIIIARHLGASGFGLFSYALAFVGVFQLLADFGLTTILVREIVRAPDRVAEIMGALRPLAWLSSLLVFAAIAALGWLFAPAAEVYRATLLLGLAVLTTFHSFSYASVCRAFEEMGFNALGNITHKLLQIGLVLAAIQGESGVTGIAAAMLAANLYQWLFFSVVVRRRYLPRLVWRFDFGFWRYLLVEAVPIGLAMVFRRANQQVGTLVLAALAPSLAVGLFNAAYKIVQMVDMIPFTLSLPLFPPIARLAGESRDRLFLLLAQAWRMFMIVAAPLAVWLWLMAPRLIELLFGPAYADAANSLRAMAVAVLLLFATALYPYLFSSLQQQRTYSLGAVACFVANLALGAILIPLYGHLGAALAMVVSEAIFFLTGAWALYRLGMRLNPLRVFCLPLLLALAALPPLVFAAEASLSAAVIYSLLYLALYLALVLYTGTLSREERRILTAFVLRRPAKQGEPA